MRRLGPPGTPVDESDGDPSPSGPAVICGVHGKGRIRTGAPGVPQLVEAWPEEGVPGFTMADTGHVSLEAFLTGTTPGTAWLLRFAAEAARVLARVHAAGILHGDISPGNLLVRPDGSDPVLADFDLATTFAEERLDFSHPSEVAGTLPYVSPERTGRTGRAADQRADLYSLGAVLYQLATGQPPFGIGAGDPLDLIHAHLAKLPAPPHELAPDLPPMLSAILLRLLEKEPDRRYASAEGLAHDLDRLLAVPPGDTSPSSASGAGTFLRGSPPRPS